LTREECDFPVWVRKRGVVSGGSHPLVVGNLKNAFADFEIFKSKVVLRVAREKNNYSQTPFRK